MSWWRSRFDAPQPNALPDDDFSYITAEDLYQHRQNQVPDHVSSGPEDDVLLIKNKGITYPVKFPAYSIGDGKLLVKDVRAQAAQVTKISDPSRLKLLYKGKQLKDDFRPCKDYSVKHQSEVLCIVGEAQDKDTNISEEDVYTTNQRQREIKKKRAGASGSEAMDSGYGTGDAIPYPEQPPTTAVAKLEAISDHFRTQLLPLCIQFTEAPPIDSGKRDFEHKKLSTAVMSEVLLLLDAVETSGDPEARAKRRSLVRDIQGVLNRMDSAIEDYKRPKIIPKASTSSSEFTGANIPKPFLRKTAYHELAYKDTSNSPFSELNVKSEDSTKVSGVERTKEIPTKSEGIIDDTSHGQPYEPDGSDIESVASLEDDIFSTSGSISTNSTAPSIRFTIIEIIVDRFMRDQELSDLYKDSIKRMDNARFVRNQKRLLKKFFVDLRSQAQTPLQQQAIKVLRGRAERTSMAEQIWSSINPSNPSMKANMAALKSQKMDKKLQLERLLGLQTDYDTNEPEHRSPSNASEDSDGSDSDGSDFAETKYPNVELATRFLVGGNPYKQYKTNIRNFLRLDADAYDPITLHEYVVTGHVSAVMRLLEQHFDDVAQLEFDWLHELLDIGCTYEEMARLLIDGENASPWILLDQPSSVTSAPTLGLHQPNCVHSGGQKLDTAPRITTTSPRRIEEGSGFSIIRETISELCGIGGAFPLASAGDGLNSDSHDWISQVHFIGHDNSLARIGYASDIYLVAPRISPAVLRMMDALDRAITAVGFLQETGLCCDCFTILRLQRMTDDSAYIELCNIDIMLLEQLRSALQVWTSDTNNVFNLDSCAIRASTIMDIFHPGPPYVPFSASPLTILHLCALAVQCVTVGILSYTQGHTGSLHPGYLVDALKEMHLLGNALELETPLPSYMIVKLLDFTCLKGMIQDSVLVFVPSPNLFSQPEAAFDLLASPEDVASTWAPARFITDTSRPDESSNLYAIEVGGGTIACADKKSEKLHWSAGVKPYDNFISTFDSKKKVLIGATTINDKCQLDETESWRHPATNAYLRHLGTHESNWELRERQAGFQGGQYVVLAFNNTFVKQPGVTLKQQQLMLPSNEIDLPFLNSTCGLQISFCTGVARRVALRELLADVMVPFIESRVSKPIHWEELKQHDIVENFRKGGLDLWFDTLSPSLRETAIYIVRSMLEVLKDTGIDKNGEELVVAWVRKESPYSCLRLRCEKTSLWARILADSEDCATFACITPLCLEIKNHSCRGLKVAPWHNVTNILDTAVCPQLSNREVATVANTIASWKLQHQVSYWIGKSGSNLIAKVWLTNEDSEPRLVVRQKAIPEKYRARLPKSMVERLGRLRERQAEETFARQVVILAEL